MTSVHASVGGILLSVVGCCWYPCPVMVDVALLTALQVWHFETLPYPTALLPQGHGSGGGCCFTSIPS